MGVSHFSSVSSTFTVTTKDVTNDVTMTKQEQADTGVLVLSATGTGKIVSFPEAKQGHVLIVRNLGANSCYVKVTGQTGVSVGAGKAAILECTGTDYVRITADA